MLKTIEVVDGFHPQPVAVRESALRLPWRDPDLADAVPDATWIADQPIDEEAGEQLRQILGPAAEAGWRGLSRMCFTVASGPWGEPEPVRGELEEWTAVVWLSRPDQCRGGIGFYQPRSATDRDNGAQQSSGWEETMFIPAAFNRMVLFRSSVAHRWGPGFGQDVASGPLVHLMMVHPISTDQ
jgi:hypothetical protein